MIVCRSWIARMGPGAMAATIEPRPRLQGTAPLILTYRHLAMGSEWEQSDIGSAIVTPHNAEKRLPSLGRRYGDQTPHIEALAALGSKDYGGTKQCVCFRLGEP
ncbi:hypothetical protein TREES_T100020706 [Tupaia chinensis]|uniref:Uncharacterized protein n=1 Tax=Tupaia chinensis TaxID=246437 RepID=L9KQX4_TUPCH|nr:hypothetical protein TREES_T100020706 [Tupaia chinensis]